MRMHRRQLPFLAYAARVFLPSLFLFLLWPAEVLAADEGPCGNFDFSGGVQCKVQVSASCSASCDAPKVVVACGGKCTATSTQTCTDTCGTTCIQQCDPQLLDCFSGCHAECDQPAIALCQEKHPNEDCVVQGKAQCDGHCKANCKVPDSSCQEHCTKCCNGSCQTQVNFDCDYKCMADVEVSCKAQCSKPTGGIFCNGQFVNATDVEACIGHLASKLNIKVDVSARVSGSAGCKDGDCSAEGKGSANINITNPSSSGNGANGCSAAQLPAESTTVPALLGAIALGTALRAIRRSRWRPRRDRLRLR